MYDNTDYTVSAAMLAQLFGSSGVVVPREVGILLIYAPNFFLKGPAKDERPVSNSDM